MGVIDKRRGSVRFKREELIGLASRHIAKRGIAWCPEELGIFSSLDVREILLLPPVVAPGDRGLPSCCWSRLS